MNDLVAAAERAITDGASLLVISDRDISPRQAPIPSLLATAALHHGLLKRRLRSQAGIIVESGEPREVMHFCLLCGYGANAINPYLAFEAVQKLHADGDLPQDIGVDLLIDQYITAVKKGLLKTISKMGISTLRSYHAAQQFEAVGLSRAVIDRYFTGTPSRIEGCGLAVIAREALDRHRAGFEPPEPGSLELDFGGEYHYRLDGEKHLWNPETIVKLQHAVVQNDPQLYAEYAEAINNQSRDLMTLRGLFEFTPCRARADRGGRAGRRNRQAVLHGSHVARLDQQGSPRDAGHRHEPPRGQLEHGRRRRRSAPLSAVGQRRFAATAASSRWPARGSA